MTKTTKRIVIAAFVLVFTLCIALFAACSLRIKHSVTVTLDYDETQGTVTLDPDKDEYDAGDEVTVTVDPKEGYEVDEFTVNGESQTLINLSYTFTVEDDTSIEVTFKTVTPAPATYTVTLEPTENGTVTLDHEGEVEEGTVVTGTIVPDDGFELDEVTINGTPVEVTGDTFTFTVEGDTTVTVTFKAVAAAGLPQDIYGRFQRNSRSWVEVYPDHLEWQFLTNDLGTVQAADVEVTTDPSDGHTVKFEFDGTHGGNPVRAQITNTEGQWALYYDYSATAHISGDMTFTPDPTRGTASLSAVSLFTVNDVLPEEYQGVWVAPTDSQFTVIISADSVTINGTPYDLGETIDEGFEYYLQGKDLIISFFGNLYATIIDLTGEILDTGFVYIVPKDSTSLPVSDKLAGVWSGVGEEGEYTVQIDENGDIYINTVKGFVPYGFDGSEYGEDYYEYYVITGYAQIYILTFSEGFGDIYDATTGDYAYLENGSEQPGPDPEVPVGDPIPEEYQGEYDVVNDGVVIGSIILEADYIEMELNEALEGIDITADDVDGVWDEATGTFYLLTITFEFNGDLYQISRSPYGTGFYLGVWSDEDETYLLVGALEQNGGEQPGPGPDIPVEPLPEAFIGTYTGEYDGVTYKVIVLSINDITLIIGGEEFKATDIIYIANWEELDFTANGAVWEFYTLDYGMFDVFRLSGNKIALNLTREGQGGEEPTDLFAPEWWGSYNVFEDTTFAIQSVEIGANSFTVNGDPVTFEYNMFGNGTFTYNGIEYIVRFDANGVFSIDWVYFVKDNATPVAIDPYFYGTWVANDGSELVISEDSVLYNGVQLFVYDQIGEGEDAVLYVLFEGGSYTISKSNAVNNSINFNFTSFAKPVEGDGEDE